MLLLNLSVADLLSAIVAYPQIIVELKMLRGLPQARANILCALTIGATPFGIVIATSIFTLAFISLNRFIYVCYPTKTSFIRSTKLTFWVIVAFWLTSLGYNIPNVFALHFDEKYAVCHRQWPEEINGTAWTVTGSLIGFIIPLSVLFLTFFATIRKFRTMPTPNSSSQQESMNRKKRAVKLLGFLILAFVTCFLPGTVYLVLSVSVKSIWPEGAWGQYARMKWIRVTFMISLTNSVADPVIYAYHNREFKKCFKEVFANIKSKFVAVCGRKYERNQGPVLGIANKGSSSGTAESQI